MDINQVISQLRSYCSSFGGRVAGAADYASGLESVVSLSLPAAFVYPLGDDVTETVGMGGSLRQALEEKIAIVLEMDNSIDGGGDRRGQKPASDVEHLKYEVFKAILNWNPSPNSRYPNGFRFVSSNLLGFDRGRLFWQMEFSLNSFISQEDGFIPGGELLQILDFTADPNPLSQVEHDKVDAVIRTSNPLTGAATFPSFVGSSDPVVLFDMTNSDFGLAGSSSIHIDGPCAQSFTGRNFSGTLKVQMGLNSTASIGACVISIVPGDTEPDFANPIVSVTRTDVTSSGLASIQFPNCTLTNGTRYWVAVADAANGTPTTAVWDLYTGLLDQGIGLHGQFSYGDSSVSSGDDIAGGFYMRVSS